MAKIIVNGEQKTLDNALTLQDALVQWGYGEQKGFAVAINGDFIPRSQYADTCVNENDMVDIVAAMQGG